MDKNSTAIKLLDIYTSLFNANRDRLEASSPSCLNKCRQEMLNLLQKQGLPVYGEEDFKRFDIDGVLSKEYQFSLGVDHTMELPKRTPIYSEDVDVLLNEGRVTVLKNTSGAFVGNIEQFQQQYPGVVESYYNTNPSISQDRLSVLHNLLGTDVLVIYLPKGCKVASPLLILENLGITPCAMSFSRYLIIAEPDASASFIMADHEHGNQGFLSQKMVEIYAHNDANITVYDIENTSLKANRIAGVHVQLQANSVVRYNTFTLRNGQTRNNFYADLQGENASFDLDGMCILNDTQVADNNVYVRHSVPKCTSDQLVKYVGAGRSLGSFTGRIYVAPDAQKTMAYQTNRNLLLSQEARMYSKPQLEIYADDVKCSHGMTTGQLDEEALFYMQQRGIPSHEATLMLTVAFMADVLDKVELPALKENLCKLVEQRVRAIAQNKMD